MGNRLRIDVPMTGDQRHMIGVLVVQKGHQLPVGTALSGVLGSRLTVHLKDRRAGFTDPVGAFIGDPAVQTFRTETAFVDSVDRPPPDVITGSSRF